MAAKAARIRADPRAVPCLPGHPPCDIQPCLLGLSRMRELAQEYLPDARGHALALNVSYHRIIIFPFIELQIEYMICVNFHYKINFYQLK